VGDGTTSVVLLAGEFMKQIKPFVEEGVHPRIIIRAFRKAMQLTVEKINSLAVKVCATVACVPSLCSIFLQISLSRHRRYFRPLMFYDSTQKYEVGPFL
jgi:chaperonin GroEL (HSP60 family)